MIDKRQTGPLPVYTTTEPPGVNIQRLRVARGWSLNGLARRCAPPLDKSSIHRIEDNSSWSRAAVERVAVALEVPVWVLFAPAPLAEFARLTAANQQKIAELIADLRLAERYRRSG